MRPTRLFFGTILIIALFALGITAFAEYDPNVELPRPTNSRDSVRGEEGYLIVNTDNLFLRTGDSAVFTPVAILDGGTYLIVHGFNGREEGLAWWYVQAGDLYGWVKDEFVIVRGDLSETPIADADGTILSPALYIGVAAPIYDVLTPAGVVVCNTVGNRFFAVVAQNATDPTWYKIRTTCDGQTVEGWVWADRGLLRNPAGVEIPIGA